MVLLLLLLPAYFSVTQIGIGCNYDIFNVAGFVLSFDITYVTHHDVHESIFDQT